MDSILAQTYTNLEILVIDDGSTDSSGKICDEYATRDSRMRVIHQENVGLAEVRNIGIRESRGEWIQFVDSDDWIDPEMIETCYNLSQEYGVDMVCSRAVYEQADGRSEQASDHYPPTLMDTSEALSLMFFTKFVNFSPCYKFSKAKLFENMTYPIGKNYEDTYATHFVVANAKKVLCTDYRFYHYLQRNTSIMHTPFSDKIFDLDEAFESCFDFASKHNEGNRIAINNLLVGLWNRKMQLISSMLLYGVEQKYPDYISKLRHDIQVHLVLTCPHITIKAKIKLLLFKFNFRLYGFAFRHFRRS